LSNHEESPFVVEFEEPEGLRREFHQLQIGIMPLVFLDTSHIHLLERVSRVDPVRYSSFRDTWQRRGCTLVWTLAQDSELGRYSNEVRRQSRYKVLSDLAPICRDVPTEYQPTDPHSLMQREILRAMVERGLITVTGADADELLRRWTDVFPGHLNSHEAELLRLNEDEALRDLFTIEHRAARWAAAAAKHDTQSKKKIRLRDLPSGPMTEEEAKVRQNEIDKAISLLQAQSQQGNLPPLSPEVLSAVRTAILETAARMAELGPQAVLLEKLPVVRYTKPEKLKLSTDELISSSLFESQVRSVARDLLGASEDMQEYLARTLDFEDCPGSWLQWRLRFIVKRSSRQPRPNHHFDAERLAYLPYVDLLLTDAEMAEFAGQVKNDKSTPARIRDLRSPVAIPATLEALEEALDSLNYDQHKQEASNT
jgi:hypothetical protein